MGSVVKKLQRTVTERLRRCLLCGHDFLSEGAHNRICRRCKGTQIWRQG